MSDPSLPATGLLIAFAGGAGAAARYLVDSALRARLGPNRSAAWPILIVNVTGSALLGLITGASLALGPDWTSVLGAGLCGGYTTFSTASLETVQLARGSRRAGLGHALGSLVAAVVAAALGMALGRAAWGG